MWHVTHKNTDQTGSHKNLYSIFGLWFFFKFDMTFWFLWVDHEVASVIANRRWQRFDSWTKWLWLSIGRVMADDADDGGWGGSHYFLSCKNTWNFGGTVITTSLNISCPTHCDPFLSTILGVFHEKEKIYSTLIPLWDSSNN